MAKKKSKTTHLFVNPDAIDQLQNAALHVGIYQQTILNGLYEQRLKEGNVQAFYDFLTFLEEMQSDEHDWPAEA